MHFTPKMTNNVTTVNLCEYKSIKSKDFTLYTFVLTHNGDATP